MIRTFTDALPDGASARSLPERDLLTDLRSAISEARASWPQIALANERFVPYLAARWPPRDAAALHAADLYICCACAHGDEAAMAALEAAHFPQTELVLTRLGLDAAARAEAMQQLRCHLFVAEPDAAPRITLYAGRGALGGWLRIVAARIATAQRTQDERLAQVCKEMSSLLEAASQGDFETQYLRTHYAEEIGAATAAALSAMTARDRTLLRLRLGGGLSVEALATMYQTHRTTCSRWLARAERSLRRRLLIALEQRLAATPSQLRSIVRLVGSRIGSVLAASLEEAPGEK